MGVELEKPTLRTSGRKWTWEVMAGALVAIKELEGRINRSYLENEHANLMLAIGNCPGGWRRIVEMAGFSPKEEARGRLRFGS